MNRMKQKKRTKKAQMSVTSDSSPDSDDERPPRLKIDPRKLKRVNFTINLGKIRKFKPRKVISKLKPHVIKAEHLTNQ